MKRKEAPRYASEAELCADFIAWMKATAGKVGRWGVTTPNWTAYAETAGWDILLVAEDGTQIGVQAKLRFNLKVLQQAVPDAWEAWHRSGPDYRAVLVPELDHAYANLCSALGLVMFAPRGRFAGEEHAPTQFSPGLDMDQGWNGMGWHYWSPEKRCELPAYVPDVVAGASGPVQLTKWKVAALQIVALLKLRGYVTRADFRELGIDPRRWTGPGGWVVPGAAPGQWIRGNKLDFDRQHPEVFAQVLVDVEGRLKARGERCLGESAPSVAAKPVAESPVVDLFTA